MKINKFITLILISILAYGLVSIIYINKSNAAMVIKPGMSTQVWTTASNSFQICRNLATAEDSSLGNNNLDPHLAKSTDWGAVTYLGLSSYGGISAIDGPTVTINVTDETTRNYSSTNGNKTGVLNFGTTVTQTASYLEGSASNTSNSVLYDENNSRYVDIISTINDAEHTRGMAYAETTGWYWTWDWWGYVSTYPDSERPVGLRRFATGYWAGGGGNNYGRDGAGGAYNSITYRPAIWNKK